ncbi:hypothetical protein ACFFU1_06505 [Algibacter miyuki]|uniref:Uncharacterized protein n=1 Tax=Algibacter miyuki TaxID=1306933 RepID=A0ABV5GY18_9FLAO|nr:hypothetical protein [Algibacter miyuki]MDN3667262.1 hypothetical protein [Algibacter miyuki]
MMTINFNVGDGNASSNTEALQGLAVNLPTPETIETSISKQINDNAPSPDFENHENASENMFDTEAPAPEDFETEHSMADHAAPNPTDISANHVEATLTDAPEPMEIEAESPPKKTTRSRKSSTKK